MNEFQFDQMEKADAGYTIPVFIIFVAIFKLLLGNMFIAIISAHYFQFQREAAEDSHGEEDANFFDLIFKTPVKLSCWRDWGLGTGQTKAIPPAGEFA